MSGEMLQICMLVNAAKNAMKSLGKFEYKNDEYVGSIQFIFLPKKKLFATQNYIAHSPNDWFAHCVKQKVVDMKILCPTHVDDRQMLGFSNTSSSSILSFYKNREVTYWTATWEFDKVRKNWNVKYKENEWKNPPNGKPKFENNIEEFKEILVKIAKFADKIEFSNFGDVFRTANDILVGNKEISMQHLNTKTICLPNVSDEKQRMFFASSTADVFGAMGSWNDSPPYYAHEKGLDDEYNKLSDELLEQIRGAMLYAINED